MGYQALLFCPDEKTARTVTQVLGELEFAVQPCTEPFAAVKKLMGEHFDAVVVDCDNEQNATLLFKSARNSTANQAALAVAVVEGQAGVAKAFRIGANLVLTKPINTDQAKGTLRVARGLLRKGEPNKAPMPTAASAPEKSSASALFSEPPVATPAPVPRPGAPAARPAPATTGAGVPPGAMPLPARAAPAMQAPQPRIPATPTAFPTSTRQDIPTASTPARPVAPPVATLPDPVFSSVASDATSSKTEPATNKELSVTSPFMVASGGAAAAAPAKTRRDLASTQTETASSRAHSEAEALFEKHVEIDKDHTAVATATPVVNPPTFTFGGANEPEESKKGPGKAFLVVILVALLAAALYFGWSRFGGKLSLPSSKPPQVAPETVPGPSAPARSSPLTNVSPAVPVPRRAMPAAQTAAQTEHSVPDEVVAPANAESAFEKSGHSSLAAPSKPSASVAEDQEPAVAPIVVKNGSVKAKRVNPAISDTPAPSVVGIASSGSGNLPNLIGTDASVPRPMLQTMNVSQGVSRGLLIKKVQPTYPPSALRAKTEGTVELLATISKEGEITAVKVISGDQLLSRAATDAVKLWKYKPYLLNGEPVEIQTQITINFRLPH